MTTFRHIYDEEMREKFARVQEKLLEEISY